MSNFATTDRPSVGEANGLVNGQGYHNERHTQEGGVDKVDWLTPGLRITRLRLLSDPGFPAWDVSYCHGMLDGRHVDVELPWSQLPKHFRWTAPDGTKRPGGWKAFLIAECKKAGVNGRALGIIDNVSTLC